MNNADNSTKTLDVAINRGGETSFHSETFTYTWVIKEIDRCQNEQNSLDIESPKIVVNEYEFQLVTRHIYESSGYYYFITDLKVLSCPTNGKNIRVRLCIMNVNGSEFSPVEKIVPITNNALLTTHKVQSPNVFSQCLSHGNLTIKCVFTIRRSVSCNNHENTDVTNALSKTSILEGYEELLHSAKFSDVTLVVGGKKFPAHKNILSTRSSVFSAMFEHDMLENKRNVVDITDVEPEVMAEVLCFIYANKVNKIKELTIDLFAAADKYELEGLRLMCENFLLAKLKIDNLAEILKLVDRYDTCPRLHDAVLQFLSSNGKEVTEWENFDRVMKTISPSLLLRVTKATMQKS